jgi:hypothetical protein
MIILVIRNYQSTAILLNSENIEKSKILKYCENLDSGIYKLGTLNNEICVSETLEEIPNLKESYSFIRVYNNGDENRSVVYGFDLFEEISYNIAFRFGCALFIDGICVYDGYLSDERCETLQLKFLKEISQK